MSTAKETNPPTRPRGMAEWHLRAPFRALHVMIFAVVAGLLAWSAERQGLDDAAWETLRAVTFNEGEGGGLGRASSRLANGFWPLQLSEVSELRGDQGEAVDNLPWLARIETRERKRLQVDPETLETVTVVEIEKVIVAPFGYAWRIAARMWETLEMGVLATLLGVVLSVPLAVLGARGYAPGWGVRQAARALVAFLRAVPELVSALFLVLAYGFGPAAGILALGLHCTGFLGKFFAEEIEHANKAPQEALAAHGAGRLKVLRFAVWPQVMPHYAGYVCYVLDRNVRMATVVGLVGAGGIGQELKGRYDLFQFGHVSTILLAIFIVVLALDQVSALVRKRAS